jgi:hypothetical protein
VISHPHNEQNVQLNGNTSSQLLKKFKPPALNLNSTGDSRNATKLAFTSVSTPNTTIVGEPPHTDKTKFLLTGKKNP